MAAARNASIAFVASPLPGRFIVQQARSLGIETVVVADRSLQPLYQHVAARVPGLRIRCCPDSQIVTGLLLAVWLIRIRLRRDRILFFHECCWPILDLLIDAIRPAGSFYPQVTMASFELVDSATVPRTAGSNLKRFIFRLFRRRFVVYRAAESSANEGYRYYFTYRRYPSSIESFPVSARVAAAGPESRTDGGDRVIFVAGTEPVPDDYLRAIYERLMQEALDEGYTVVVKDHPTQPLGARCSSSIALDPTLPIELIEDSFAFSVGVASTGLLAVGRRKLSVIRALEAMPEDVRESRLRHLTALPGGDRIELVSSLSELRQTLRAARERPRAAETT